MKLSKILSIGCLFVAGSAVAQVLSPEQKKEIYRDSFLDYDNSYDIDSIRNFQQRLVVDYPPIREADVMWSKRVWREIELREKINLPLYYPIDPIQDRKSLIEIIKLSYQEGLIQPFHKFKLPSTQPDDEFTIPIGAGFTDTNLFGYTYKDYAIDPITNEPTEEIVEVYQPFQTSEVVAYRLKEDWYFDKQHSQLRVKILGLQPLFSYLDKGEKQNKFRVGSAWFYFPELRHVLVNYEAFNKGNKTQRLTFDDIFIKRKFSSHIVKEQNVYDREIDDYKKDPYETLIEGERIKDEINLFEHDLWSY
jgi:gliding motility associated protien GldN